MVDRGVQSLGLLALLWSGIAYGQQAPLRELIDQSIEAGWKTRKIEPAAQSDDATFLRRVYLDVIGTIPTYEETKAFLADKDSAKRAKLVDRLLDDPRYATHQAKVWELVIFNRENTSRKMGSRDALRKWLQARFAENAPYDQWVKELIVADGSSQDEGAAMFYVQYDASPEQITVGVTRTFLGMQLQCAECHDHPYEKWTQRDFYGMAAFFARLTLESADSTGRNFSVGEKEIGDVLFTGPAKDAKPGQKGEPIAPKFIGGKPYVEPAPTAAQLATGKVKSAKGKPKLPKPKFSRKDQFAAWLVGGENEYFAKAAVNRVWGQFMRRGIVHPVDALGGENEPSHPELLDRLTAEFKAHQFDLKWLIREIANSKAYQLASAGPHNKPVAAEQMTLRPLIAEELVSSLRTTMGFQSSDVSPDNFERNMLRYLGRDAHVAGDFQASLTEQLFLNNGSAVPTIISGRTSTALSSSLFKHLASSELTDEERVDRLFLSALSRPPRPEERVRFVEHLSKAKKESEKQDYLEEAIWAVVMSAEYRFNH